MNALYRNNPSFQQRRGQVATFFALSFVMVMVFLLIVLNTGLMTRDKIKIQNTADLAALVGANVQRFNLNRIDEINDKIETTYLFFEGLLANPYTASYCAITQATCGQANGGAAPAQIQSTIDKYKALTALNGVLGPLGIPVVDNPEPPAFSACQAFCGAKDSTYAHLTLLAYLTIQMNYQSQIMGIVQKANSKAYDYAKLTALAAPNVPVDVKRQLLQHFGSRFPTPQQMVKDYNGGGLRFDYGSDGQMESLNEIYRISANDSQPLYIPKISTIPLVSYRGTYSPCVTGGLTFDAAMPCFNGTFQLPMIVPVPYKIIDTGDVTPSFLTAVSYSPQFLFNKIAARKLPDAQDPFKPGRIFNDSGTNQNVNLFDMLLGKVPFAPSDNRQFMSAWAAARPYGGSPENGGYDGAKLIGLASRAIHEVVQEFGIKAKQTTADQSAEHTFTENDFLH